MVASDDNLVRPFLVYSDEKNSFSDSVLIGIWSWTSYLALLTASDVAQIVFDFRLSLR